MRNISIVLVGLMIVLSSVYPAPKRVVCPTTIWLRYYNNGKVVAEEKDCGMRTGMHSVDMIRVWDDKEYVTDSIIYEIRYK